MGGVDWVSRIGLNEWGVGEGVFTMCADRCSSEGVEERGRRELAEHLFGSFPFETE